MHRLAGPAQLPHPQNPTQRVDAHRGLRRSGAMLPKIPLAWRQILAPATQDPTYRALDAFLDQEVAEGKQILPPRKQIFAALELCPPEAVRVVLLGQDPYPTPGDAHGLCFSVQHGRPLPRSLRNIYKELHDDLGIPPPPHGNLEHWARQGVLLLNTVLTVRVGEANSHRKKGWELFTDSIIRHLATQPRPLVFLLWGNAAQSKRNLITHPGHSIVACAHPSPLSARLFLGSRCFSEVNRKLKRLGAGGIEWVRQVNKYKSQKFNCNYLA